MNKKVSDPSAETEEVKAPADIQVKVSEEHKMYRKALTRAWKRLGYSNELAELRTQIICTGEESELEWLAEQVRNRQFRREEKGFGKKTDITVVLDKWLDKYESIEDIKKIVQTVTVK